MLRIFFDAEFTALTEDAKLISIGFIDETGEHSFYAELSDTWRLSDAGEFAKNAVLPLLEGKAARRSTLEIGQQLFDWVGSFSEPVVLATDSLVWDWPWIKVIFDRRGAWPKNLAREPLLLTMNYLNAYDQFEVAVEDAFSSGLRRHHALDDAKAHRLGWFAAGGDIMKSIQAS